MKKIITSMIFALSATIMVSGCSSSDSTPPPTTLTGTAATGAPINGTVFVKDAKGIEKSIATAVNGSFTLDVPNMTPPYLLKIMPSSGPELYSYASKNGQTVNLTPMTNTAVFLAYGKKDLNTLYVGWDGTGVTASAIDDAEGVVRANLESQMTAQGIDAADYDLFTSSFSADGKGIDAVMDNLKVILDPGAGTVTFTDAGDVDMGFDEAITPIAPPQNPAPADAITITTVSGGTHQLNGTYYTACYSPGGTDGQIDSVTITGTVWVNAQAVFTADKTCTGVPDKTGSITATITKGSDKPISGWKVSQGGAPNRLDGNGLISASTTVTAFSLSNFSIADPDAVYGGFIPPTTPVPGFYVFDDTGSGFAMYRDKDGSIAGKSDPYIRR